MYLNDDTWKLTHVQLKNRDIINPKSILLTVLRIMAGIMTSLSLHIQCFRVLNPGRRPSTLGLPNSPSLTLVLLPPTGHLYHDVSSLPKMAYFVPPPLQETEDRRWKESQNMVTEDNQFSGPSGSRCLGLLTPRDSWLRLSFFRVLIVPGGYIDESPFMIQ